MKIKQDGSVALLFEWGVSVLGSNGKEKHRIGFGNDILQNYSFGDGKYNVIVTSASQSGYSVVTVFDNKGKEISQTQFDRAVISVDQLNDRFAVLTADSIYIYDVKGKLVSQRDNSDDSTSILLSSKNAVVTVSASRAVYNKMN